MLQVLVNGLLYGGVLSISAVGFSLIFGVLDIINLTHGIFVIGGAYAALVAWSTFGIDPLVALAPIMFIAFLFGGMLERFVILPAVRRGSPVAALLVTFGISLIGVNFLTIAFSSSVRNVSPAYAFSSIQIGGVTIDAVRAITFVTALLLIALLSLFLRASSWGRIIRATAQSELGARLSGVDAVRVYSITFAVGSSFAAGAGVLLSMILPFTPAEEVQWTIYAFVVVTLGGVGSPAGALLGGLLLGVVTTFTQTYVGAIYANAIMFLILLLMLLVRPSGIINSAFKMSK